MKKCKSIYIPAFFYLAIITMLLMNAGCSNLESNQSVEPSDASMAIGATSTADLYKSTDEKCTSTSQEINDRWEAYVTSFMNGNVDAMYNFWISDYLNITDNSDQDRDELYAEMTASFANGTKLNYTWQLLEQNVFDDVAYNIGGFHNDATVNGAHYVNNGYYFTRMTRGHDGLWLIDKNVAGFYDNNSSIDPTAIGSIVCYDKQAQGNRGNEMVNQQITDRFNAYIKALTSSNPDVVSQFWTEDLHYYGGGLDVDRDGLYQYYQQFFQKGSILASSINLKYRYVHGNVVYDIGQSDNTEVVNGVQSIKKHNYVIRWEKGHDRVWRISRFINLNRN